MNRPSDLSSALRFYMFNELESSKFVKLWHPYPRPQQRLHRPALQRSVFPGDVVSITSDGRANVKFNLFYSESENLFYGNYPPPGYVAFGPPLDSYQECEEHNIDRLHPGVEGYNYHYTGLAPDDKTQPVFDKPQTTSCVFL